MKKSYLIYVSFFMIIILGLSSMNLVSAYKSRNNQIDGLSYIEIQGILFLREEEKLARDVYYTFSLKYTELQIFKKIASSEQKHMDAVKNLIDKYNLTTNTTLKDLIEVEIVDFIERTDYSFTLKQYFEDNKNVA